MSNVIRWHDHEKAAKCWASEAKYRRMVANGLVPELVASAERALERQANVDVESAMISFSRDSARAGDSSTAPCELSYDASDGDVA